MFNLCTYILLLVCSLIAPSVSYVITVDAHAEECFFDKVESGTKMGNSSAKYFSVQKPISVCSYRADV